MPNLVRGDSLYLQNGTPDSFVQALTGGPGDLPGTPTTPGSYTPYAPGQEGLSFELNDKTYTPVIVDSGCTAATPVGLVAAGQLLFWKDKPNRIVTNDQRMAYGGSTTNAARNFVAGIARTAVTAANLGTGGALICMLVKGYNISVASDGSGGVGQSAIADGTAGTARVTPIAVGGQQTYQNIGYMRSTPANSAVNVDVELPILP